jgi:hypothetical protein
MKVYTKLIMIMESEFLHSNIRKYTWTSPDNSIVFHVRSLKAADCDADQYLVVIKGRERLAVNK